MPIKKVAIISPQKGESHCRFRCTSATCKATIAGAILAGGQRHHLLMRTWHQILMFDGCEMCVYILLLLLWLILLSSRIIITIINNYKYKYIYIKNSQVGAFEKRFCFCFVGSTGTHEWLVHGHELQSPQWPRVSSHVPGGAGCSWGASASAACMDDMGIGENKTQWNNQLDQRDVRKDRKVEVGTC